MVEARDRHRGRRGRLPRAARGAGHAERRARLEGGAREPRGRGEDRAGSEADPLRRSARPHDVLGRRVHREPADAAGRGRASAGRRLRLRALLLRRSTSGASTTTPRAITPEHWQETKDAIRQCNAVAGDPTNPDVVAFLGWEWTQVGATPDDHYGHKNVIFRDTAEDEVPTRPISALSAQLVGALRERAAALAAHLRSSLPTGRIASATSTSARYQNELAGRADLPGRRRQRASCPTDCHEAAQTPAGAVREARAVGLRRDRHPARHDLGPLHAARLDTGQAAHASAARSREADADRGVLRPRQLRGVPRPGRRSTSTRAASPVCPAPTRGLPALLLAGRRDHPRALRRCARRRVRAARRRSAQPTT